MKPNRYYCFCVWEEKKNLPQVISLQFIERDIHIEEFYIIWVPGRGGGNKGSPPVLRGPAQNERKVQRDGENEKDTNL